MFGGVGVYVLCRSSRMTPFAAAVAGGLWCTSPYVLAQAYEGHYPHVWAASFSPWAFWAALGWRRGRLRGWLLAPILALSMLTGHAQEAYYLGLALGAWLAALCLWPGAKPGLGMDRVKRLAPRIAALVVLTVGLVAVEVVPDLLARPYVCAPTPALGGRRRQVSR